MKVDWCALSSTRHVSYASSGELLPGQSLIFFYLKRCHSSLLSTRTRLADMPISASIRRIITVARPGFWTTQLWFYLLPLGGYRLLDEPTFWLGASYAMLPLGHLLYGWNDLADYRTDQLNPRKGNLLFGAKLTPEELRKVPLEIVLVQLPFWAAFTWLIGPKFLIWAAATLVVNALYNWPRVGLKNLPFLDLANQTGYLLLFVLSSWVNAVPQLPWPAFAFGALFAMHSHLLGQMSDVEPDRAAGRRTTAVVIGVAASKLLAATFLLVEAWLVAHYFHSPVLVAFLVLGGVGFALDFAIRKDATVTARQLAWVLIAWNVAAVASMYWVWREGVFVVVG